MSETPPPPVQPAPGEIPPVPAVEAVRIRAIVHNAADRALSARGYWVPLRVRIGIAETVLSALAVYGYAVVPSESAGDRSDGDAPTRGCEAPGGGRDAVSRLLRSSDDGMASEGRTALRDRYAEAAETVRRSWMTTEIEPAGDGRSLPERIADAVLAVRDNELAALRREVAYVAETGEKWRRLCEEIKRDRSDALVRAEEAEAAIVRVRRLCDLTIAASCRVQAIDQAVDTLAALEMTAKDVAACGDRCPQVYGTREVVCTLPKGHAAHRSGGTAWEALCDEVAQRAEQDSAALARVRSLAEEWRVTPLAYGKPPTPGHIWRRAGNALLEALDVPADGEPPTSKETPDA